MHTSILRTIAAAGLLLICSSCGPQRAEVWLDDIDPIPVSEESSTSDPALYAGEPKLFEDVFAIVGEVQLADDIVLGEGVSPFVGPQGQILALDGDLALLFDAAGNLITQVTPEACNPGYEWNPSNAQFLPGGGFLVFGFSRDGYWFDADGQCTGVFPHRAFTRTIALAADSTVFAAKLSSVDWQLLRYGRKAPEVDTLFTGRYTVLGTRVIAGGMSVSEDGDLFIGVFHSPFIYRFRSGRFEKLGRVPDYFKVIPTDLTEAEMEGSNAWMQKMMAMLREHSALGSVYQLDAEHVAVTYINVEFPNEFEEVPAPSAVHIMDLNGIPVTKGPVFIGDVRPVYAGNGAFYTRVYDESGGDDAPLNPKIVEYRFAPK